MWKKEKLFQARCSMIPDIPEENHCLYRIHNINKIIMFPLVFLFLSCLPISPQTYSSSFQIGFRYLSFSVGEMEPLLDFHYIQIGCDDNKLRFYCSQTEIYSKKNVVLQKQAAILDETKQFHVENEHSWCFFGLRR